MKKNRIDSFTCFVGFLLILALFFSIKLFAGIQDGKKQYLALVSLGDLTYDDDFLKKAKKIERIDYFHTLYLTFHIIFLNSTNLNFLMLLFYFTTTVWTIFFTIYRYNP